MGAFLLFLYNEVFLQHKQFVFMDDFNNKAKEWDLDPAKLVRAAKIAEYISENISGGKDKRVLEYGAGTGQVSVHLKDHFGYFVLMDQAEGMIDVLKEKIKNHHLMNFHPLVFDLMTQKWKGEKFDVIYTVLTLHHVSGVEQLLKRFGEILKPGGKLVIVDLYKEDGTFHGEDNIFEGHHGFNPDELIDLLHQVGFQNGYQQQCLSIRREQNTRTRDFPVFCLCTEKM